MVEKLELTDGHVLLRPYQLSDVRRLHEAACESIPEVGAWMEWCHPDYSIDESRDWVKARDKEWQKGTAYDFTMVDPKDGSYLGGCGLNGFRGEHGIANLGYWVRTSRTKRGVATASTRLLARFGLNELKLNRIEIVAAVGNRASQRVAEKAGATREGIFRNGTTQHGKICDAVMFSLIRKDIL